MAKLKGFQAVLESLERAGVSFEVFDRVRVEPNDISLKDAIDFARAADCDSFVAFGGGSTIVRGTLSCCEFQKRMNERDTLCRE